MVRSVLKLDVVEDIAYLTINDPPKNAMSLSFFDELNFLTKTSLPNLRAKGMIVSGEGRHFSSGADVSALTKALNHGDRGDLIRDNNLNLSWLENAPFPVVAAINGCCLGSGLELALACHFRVAAKRAVFAFPEVEFGLVPGMGGTVRLPELVSYKDAVEMIMTGRSILADEARELGIVDLVVDKRALMDTARKCIRVLEKEKPSTAGNRQIGKSV